VPSLMDEGFLAALSTAFMESAARSRAAELMPAEAEADADAARSGNGEAAAEPDPDRDGS